MWLSVDVEEIESESSSSLISSMYTSSQGIGSVGGNREATVLELIVMCEVLRLSFTGNNIHLASGFSTIVRRRRASVVGQAISSGGNRLVGRPIA
jgi:hypothetical protein